MKIIANVKKKSLIIVALILALIILFITLISSGSINVFSKNRKLPIYSVDIKEKTVALTFDCAWGMEYTDRLIEIMKGEDITCTFFMVEFWTTKYPDYVKKLDDAGFEIGTHSSTHPYMSKLSSDNIIRELNSSVSAIEKIINKKVEVFRPPYGDYNDTLIECATELNLFTIQWDVDSLDWKNLSANDIYNRVIKRVQNGSIILFHNNGLHTAEALPMIIKWLKGEGYSFTSVGKLIYRDNYQIDSNGRQFSIN